MPYYTLANKDDHFLIKTFADDALETLYLQLRSELGYNEKPWRSPKEGDDTEEMRAKRALYDIVSEEYSVRRSRVNSDLVSDMLWEKAIQQGDKGDSGRPNSTE